MADQVNAFFLARPSAVRYDRYGNRIRPGRFSQHTMERAAYQRGEIDRYEPDSDEPKEPTDKELAENWKMPETCWDRCVIWLMLFLSAFYDFSAAVISIVDVTTDALVTYEFYRDDKMFFFVFSLCIMLVAHLAFSFLFIALYCDHNWTDKERVVMWFCMMPFSQTVPLFIWIHSFEFEWFIRMLEYFGLNTDQPGTGNIREDEDPLMVWIKKKLSSHGGFIMEACIEAFPQSILQMISIVVYHEHTSLNIASVIISMTAVASKSVMLSYNIDRKVFFFNFTCFVGDIFNVFATVAWVFHSKDKSAYVDSTLSWIWVYKLCGLAILIFIFGLLQIRRYIYDLHPQCCQTWSRTLEGIWFFIKGVASSCCGNVGAEGCWLTVEPSHETQYIRFMCYCNCGYSHFQNPVWKYSFKRYFMNCLDWILLMFEFLVLWPLAMVLFLIMATGLYIFSIMAAEIFKLGFFPLMIMGAGQQHRHAIPFYRYLFSFLQTSRNNKDCKLRLALTNQMFLQRHFDNVAKETLNDPDSLELRHKQEVFVRCNPTSITYTEMHGFNTKGGAMSCGECLRMCFIDGLKENFWKWIYCECFDVVEECYFFTVGVPYDVLSALFTIFFPIIALAITPKEDWTALQEALTFIYISALFIVIALSVYVYKFFRLSESIFAPITTKTTPVVDEIIAYWKDFVSTRIRDEVIHNYFGDIAPIIIGYAGNHRVYDTDWVPPLDWQEAGYIEGDYQDWKFKAPYQNNRPGETATDVLAIADKGIYEDGKVTVAVNDQKVRELDHNVKLDVVSEEENEDKKEEEEFPEKIEDDFASESLEITVEPEDATTEFSGSIVKATRHFKDNPEDKRIVKVFSEFKQLWFVNSGSDRTRFTQKDADHNTYDPTVFQIDSQV